MLKTFGIVALLLSPFAASHELAINYGKGDGQFFGSTFRYERFAPFTIVGDLALYTAKNIVDFEYYNGYIGAGVGVKVKNPYLYVSFETTIGSAFKDDPKAFIYGANYGSYSRVTAGLNFMTKVGAGIRSGDFHCGFLLTHISNGGLRRPNPGRNWLGAEFGYSF